MIQNKRKNAPEHPISSFSALENPHLYSNKLRFSRSSGLDLGRLSSFCVSPVSIPKILFTAFFCLLLPLFGSCSPEDEATVLENKYCDLQADNENRCIVGYSCRCENDGNCYCRKDDDANK